jgi:hypothetical protein
MSFHLRASVFGCIRAWVVTFGALCPLADVSAQEILDALEEKLVYTSAEGNVQADFSVVSDVTLFAAELPPQGLLLTNSELFLAPRLSVFLDVQFGERVILHGQMRADRGFDPGYESGGQVRLDEYFLQLRAAEAEKVNLRAGKYPTVFGSWAPRSLAWDSPLVTAPAPYEELLPITDSAAPATLASFAARRDMAANKTGWVPIIWGPSYATGAAVLGRIEAFDYALEVKNASLSSRPETWDAIDNGFQTQPTTSVRLGLQPSPEWTLGSSFSRGPYMQESAQASLPTGTSVDDFHQTTWGLDAGYAHRDWQVWSELIHATFDVPRVGEVDVLSGYIEAKYKITPQYWVVLRVNQSWFGDIPGLTSSWDRNTSRLDLGLGYRYSTHIGAKFQYSYAQQQGPDTEGNHLFAAQVIVRF